MKNSDILWSILYILYGVIILTAAIFIRTVATINVSSKGLEIAFLVVYIGSILFGLLFITLGILSVAKKN